MKADITQALRPGSTVRPLPKCPAYRVQVGDLSLDHNYRKVAATTRIGETIVIDLEGGGTIQRQADRTFPVARPKN